MKSVIAKVFLLIIIMFASNSFASPPSDNLVKMMMSKTTWGTFNWDKFTKSKLYKSFDRAAKKKLDNNMVDLVIPVEASGFKAKAVFRENHADNLRLALLEFEGITEDDATKLLAWCKYIFGSDFTESSRIIPFMEKVNMGFFGYQWIIGNTAIYFLYNGMIEGKANGNLRGYIIFRDIKKADIFQPDIKVQCRYNIEVGPQKMDRQEIFIIESSKDNKVKDEKMYIRSYIKAKVDDSTINLTIEGKKGRQILEVNRLTGILTGTLWMPDYPDAESRITGECTKIDKLSPKF